RLCSGVPPLSRLSTLSLHDALPISGLDLKDRLVAVQRVTKVTKGGRAFGFSAIVVVGNEEGVVGQGLGKSKDVATAIAKAIEDRSEEHTSELQSRFDLVCRLLLEKK